MSNARNKRAVEPGDAEPFKKRGRRTKDELNLLIPEDSMSRVQARQMLSRNPKLEYSNQEESSFYDGLVPWPGTYEWSDEDKAAVAEEWRRSDVRIPSSKLHSSQHTSLLLLFKISLRLYRTAPIVLLSPVMGMRYQPVSTNPTASKWIMGHEFCKTLSSLMVHPCWEEDIDSLALALRWAVICRLDSRHKWFVGLDYSCPVIQRTLDNVESSEGRSSSYSYHEMHEAERERASDRGEPLSILSDILHSLGETVPKEAGRPEADPEYDFLFGRCVLPVTKWDLDVLVKVVNAMKFQPQWNYSVKDAMSAWKAERPNVELPSRDKLPLIYELIHRSIFRYLRFYDRHHSGMSSTGEAGIIQNSDSFSSHDDGPQQNTRPTHHQSRRRTVTHSSSDEESDLGSGNTGSLPLHCPRDDSYVDEEYNTPVRPVGSDMSLIPASQLMSEEEDDGMVGNADGASLDESPPPESTIYASVRVEDMFSELLELRKENKELRDDRRRLENLVAEGFKRQDEVIDKRIKDLMRQGQEEQKKLMLDMKTELLESVRTELRQLSHGSEASNQGSAVQSLERPSLPDVAGTVSEGAPGSPDLGTTTSTEFQLDYDAIPNVWRTVLD